jgi:hypothetical protein
VESRRNIYAADYLAWQAGRGVDAATLAPHFDKVGWRALDCDEPTWARWDAVISARADATRAEDELEAAALRRAAREIYETWGGFIGKDGQLKEAKHPFGWFNARDQLAIAAKLGEIAAKHEKARTKVAEGKAPAINAPRGMTFAEFQRSQRGAAA